MKYNVIALFLFLPFVFAFAQAPDTVWTKSYNPEWFGGAANSVQQTVDGGYIIGGVSLYLFHQWYGSVYVLKTDNVGNQMWAHDYDPDVMPISEAYDVRQTADGGYVVAGILGRQAPGTLFKIDSAGSVQWERTYGYRTYAVCLTSDAGYIACGDHTYSLVKTDSLGNWEWHLTLPASLYGVQPAVDGGYCAAGSFRASNEDSWDFYAVKTNSIGDIQWVRTYGGNADDLANSICAAQDGGFLLAGYTYSYSDNSDIYLVRIDGDGDTLWTRFYGITEYDVAISVSPTFDGGFIVAGFTDSLCHSVPYVIRLNSSGDILWTKIWGSEGGGGFFSVQQTSDSGYIAAGQYNGLIYLAKLDSDSLPVAPRDIAALPSQYSFVVYPNPFNSSTTLSFILPRAGRTVLTVYDIMGRKVRLLQNDLIQVGTHRIVFNASTLPSGVYFAYLRSDRFSATQKLLLLK